MSTDTISDKNFYEDPVSSFYVKLITDRQTDRQTDRHANSVYYITSLTAVTVTGLIVNRDATNFKLSDSITTNTMMTCSL